MVTGTGLGTMSCTGENRVGNQGGELQGILTTDKVSKIPADDPRPAAAEDLMHGRIHSRDHKIVVSFNDGIHGAAEQPRDFFFPFRTSASARRRCNSAAALAAKSLKIA